MRLEQLQYVIEVADCKLINVAAEKLFLTPQNVSKAIRQLEDELRIQIFTRTKYGMFLTNDGQIVYNIARSIRSEVELLEKTFKNHDSETAGVEEVRGTISMIAPASMHTVLHALLRDYMKTYTNVQVIYSERESNYILRTITRDAARLINYDMVFLSCSEKKIPEFSAITDLYDVYILSTDRMCVLMSDKSPYAKQQSITLKTLANLPLAGFVSFNLYSDEDKNSSPQLSEWLEEYGINLNFTFLTDSYENWEGYIQDGMAYGLVGSEYVKHMVKGKGNPQHATVVVPLKEKITTARILLVAKYKKDSTAKQLLLSRIKDYFRTSNYQL